jgi:TatA/E family protein of Tat protein translocase
MGPFILLIPFGLLQYPLLFGVSGGEILILLLLVLVLFGPSKIPEIARMLGRGINEVKKVQREINTEIHRYSSEIEKETSKMQSEINQLKDQVARSAEGPAGEAPVTEGDQSGGGPPPDPYEEARKSRPKTGPERPDPAKTKGEDAPGETDQAAPEGGPHKDDQLPSHKPDMESDSGGGEDDLPYPYNRKNGEQTP